MIYKTTILRIVIQKVENISKHQTKQSLIKSLIITSLIKMVKVSASFSHHTNYLEVLKVHAYIKLSSGNISYLNRKNSANQPPQKRQPEAKINLKSSKFEAYTKANNMDFFVKNEMHDDVDTVVFQSNLKVGGQTIPLGIITDNTVYTIIRVQLGAHVLNETNKPILLNYLNKLNRSFKVFKYVIAEDGSIFLDACLPSTNDSFDAEIVRVVLDVIVDHLNNEYKNIMKQAWE